MTKTLKFLILSGVLFSGLSLSAQSLASAADHPEFQQQASSTVNVQEFLDPQDAFFMDIAGRICFIDFQSLKLNLRSVQLVDNKGNVILHDQVDHLPVNSIYEVNFSDRPSGKYQIVLEGYTETITRSFSF
ncbi:MAG: hypothetical protein H6568_00975 [Lewinellaceae bacterium]|nr:hypothetical protein [Lewinellaceae bacterium]